MRAIIQRVSSASVSVGGQRISSIGPGLCVLVGISRGDTEKDAEYICRKVLNMKLWDDPKSGKPWQQSVMSAGYEVLFVSQFTLYAQTHKGNRPDFSKAMAPKEAKPTYEAFLSRARADYQQDRVKDGEFGAHMLVDIANDGPVTIVLDTSELSSTADSDSGTAASAGVEAITDEDVTEWHSLPTVPKHNNKKGRPSPEHMAAAKSAKDRKRAFVERLIARIGAGGAILSVKAVEAALNSRKPMRTTASTAVEADQKVPEKVMSPVSSLLQLESAKVHLPVPKLPPQYFSSIDSLADHHTQPNSASTSPARGGSNRSGGDICAGTIVAPTAFNAPGGDNAPGGFQGQERLRIAESRVAELEARVAQLERRDASDESNVS